MEQQIRLWQAISWKALSDRSKDLAIALVIATIGLAGSYVILGRSIRSEIAENPTVEPGAFGNTNVFGRTTKASGALKTSNEDLLVIQGSFFTTQTLTISFIEFRPERQYMIDFGNGIRQICRNNISYVRYQDPGTYYVLYYEMQDNRWQIVSSQAITIRS